MQQEEENHMWMTGKRFYISHFAIHTLTKGHSSIISRKKIRESHCCVIISPTITTEINIYGDALESVQKYVSDSPHHTT